ncbi:hypothetical protein KTH73_04025 [Acinetobacter courvalinii]|uniref:hypothetical protein n=1 Tax=Acinetobacter courvalinii TaxID=280147 RepID=UPI0021CD988D|nr:hypothetical protein [Acinetobacter courvalinii]MCU4389895.1 hypothetical protein [Acinetobacter courvalinii]
MAEPVSTVGVGAFFKIYGMAIVVILSSALIAMVVMMIRMPRNPQEWAVGLICTVVSSITGGSFFIVKFGLHDWVNDVWGVLALGGFFFACGLPGWFLVRLTANFMSQRESKNILEVVRELKKEVKDGEQ